MIKQLVFVFLAGILLLSSIMTVSANPSTNPADYFFYDPMGGGSMGASYANISSGAYSTTNPYPGGSFSIQINSSANVNFDNNIATANFSSVEYSTPYCLSYMAYETQAATNNNEAGIIFSAWASALVHNRDSSSSTSNLTYINDSVYTQFSSGIGQNVWANLTFCFTQGYSATGFTTGIMLVNGVNVKNTSNVILSRLSGVGLHNRLPSSGIMYIGLLRIWNYTAFGTAGPLNTSGVNVVTAQLYNNVTGSSIGTTTFSNVTGNLTFTYFNVTSVGFCVTYTGNGTATNCTTSGSGSSTFYNVTKVSVITGTQSVIDSSYQALVNLSAYQRFVNTSVLLFNATNNKMFNTTTNGGVLLKALNGTNNVLVVIAGNYSQNVTCNVPSPFQMVVCNATGFYDNVFTIGANFEGTSVSAFTVNVSNTVLGVVTGISTTNGSVNFLLLQGYDYVFSIDAFGYTRQNVSLAANASTNLHNFSLLISRQLTFIFREEITRNIINTTNMTLELISDVYATNVTSTNGTIVNALPLPSEYTFRYRGGNYTERQYFLNVTNDTNQNVTLYAIDINDGELIGITVSDTGANLLEGATVSLLRYFLYCNCYEIVEMERTSFEGTTSLWVQPIEGHYKWAVDYNGINYFISTSPETITVDSKFFSIDIGQNFYASYQTLSQVGTAITVNATTGTISYTWSDPSGSVSSACITTSRYVGVIETIYSQSCASGSTGGVITTINTTDGRRYKYVSTVNTTQTYNQYHVIATGFYEPSFGYDFGNMGTWLSILLLVVVAVIFSYSVAAVLISAALVLLVVTALGLLTFTTSFIAGVIAIIIGMVVFLLRS